MRYLVITYVKKPDGATDEQVQVVNRLRDRDVSLGSVIMDFQNQRVIKSSVGDQSAPKDWQRIRDFYHRYYAQIIEQLENKYFEQPNHTD